MSGAISIGAVALAVGTGFATGFTTFAVVGILGATLGAIGTIAKIKELQYAGMALGAVGAIGGVAASMGAFASEAATAATAGADVAGSAATGAGEATNFVGTAGAGAGGTAGEIANASAQAATGSAGAAQGAATAAAPVATTAAPEVAASAVNVAEWGGQGGYDAINMVNGFEAGSTAGMNAPGITTAASSALPSTEAAGTFQPDSLLNQQVGLAETPPDVTVADFSPTTPTGTEGTMVADSGTYSGASSTDTLAGGTGSDSLTGGVQVDEAGNIVQGDSLAKTTEVAKTGVSPTAGSDTAVTGGTSTTQPASQGTAGAVKTTFGTTSNTGAGEFAKGPLVGSDTAATDAGFFSKVGTWAEKNPMLVYGGLQMISGLGKGLFGGESGKAPPSEEELELMRAQAARNYAAEAIDKRRAYNMADRAPNAVWGTPPWITPPNPLPTAEGTPAQIAARTAVPTGLINSPGQKVTGSVTV